MGIFGRGQEIQFFMSDEDHKEFLQKIDNKEIFFVKDIPYKSKKIKLYEKIPQNEWPTNLKSKIWFIYNRRFGKLQFEYKGEWLKAYKIIQSRSPVIQFHRSCLHKHTLSAGRIAAMLSTYEYDRNNKKIEIKQSEGFVRWWEEAKKVLKKMCVKCYLLDPVTKKEKYVPIWVGPDAVQLYKEGMTFKQILNDKSGLTFHPIKLNIKRKEK